MATTEAREGTFLMDNLITAREQKDMFFKLSPYSPLSPQQQQKFDHLSYYDPTSALAFEVACEEFSEKKNVQMQTSTGETRYYLRWGKVRFEVDGQQAELTLYFSPGQEAFFVPFMDVTNGSETYSGGRYLEVTRGADGNIWLDFNLAY